MSDDDPVRGSVRPVPPRYSDIHREIGDRVNGEFSLLDPRKQARSASGHAVEDHAAEPRGTRESAPKKQKQTDRPSNVLELIQPAKRPANSSSSSTRLMTGRVA